MSDNIQTRNGLYGYEFRDVDKRRASEGERKTYDIKQLWQRNHEIVNLSVQGFKNVEIAEILDITPESVSMTLNSELGQKKVSELRFGRDEEVKRRMEKIRILTNKALSVYNQILEDDSGESSLKDKKAVADTVALEIGGLRAPTRIQSSFISTTLTLEEIEAFKQRGLEAAKQMGKVVDVTEESKDGTESEAVGDKEKN